MMPDRPSRSAVLTPAQEGEAGFTLVEALVAFMIVALALTMGLRVLVNGALWARRGPEAVDRIEEAASIMNELIGDRQLQSGSTAGRFAGGEPWRVRVTDVTSAIVPNAKTPLLRIEIFGGSGTGGKPLLTTMAIGQ